MLYLNKNKNTIYLSDFLFVYISNYLSNYLFAFISDFLSDYLFVYITDYLPDYLFVNLIKKTDNNISTEQNEQGTQQKYTK